MSTAQDAIVLYVDDDVANRTVFEITFASRFPLVVCDGARAALEVIERRRVAVLLADQRMPEMSGNELLRLVRQRSPDTVGVIITAHDDVPPLLEAVNQQLAARYIIKPWRSAEIEAAVSWGFEVYRLGREKAELQVKLLEGERLTTLGSIATGVLHDLEQPLTALQSNLERLGQMLSDFGTAPPEAREALVRELGEPLSEANVAVRAFGEILKSAQRYLSPGRSGVPAAGDVGLAARQAVTLCRYVVSERGGVLRSRIADGLPEVSMSTSELTQVIVNLLVNAAQALVPGRRPAVELGIGPADGGVQIVVADNGRGMAPEVLARACEPFYTTKEGEVGTGLGLFNTQRLVDQAGGRLTLESRMDEGTTATIFLPAAMAAAAAPAIAERSG